MRGCHIFMMKSNFHTINLAYDLTVKN